MLVIAGELSTTRIMMWMSWACILARSSCCESSRCLDYCTSRSINSKENPEKYLLTPIHSVAAAICAPICMFYIPPVTPNGAAADSPIIQKPKPMDWVGFVGSIFTLVLTFSGSTWGWYDGRTIARHSQCPLLALKPLGPTGSDCGHHRRHESDAHSQHGSWRRSGHLCVADE